MINKVYKAGKLYGYRYGNIGKIYSVKKHGEMGAIKAAEKRGRAVSSSGWQAVWKAKYSVGRRRRYN